MFGEDTRERNRDLKNDNKSSARGRKKKGGCKDKRKKRKKKFSYQDTRGYRCRAKEEGKRREGHPKVRFSVLKEKGREGG